MLSAAKTVKAVQKKLKLDEDSATLYLQMLTLPDPTKANEPDPTKAGPTPPGTDKGGAAQPPATQPVAPKGPTPASRWQ